MDDLTSATSEPLPTDATDHRRLEFALPLPGFEEIKYAIYERMRLLHEQKMSAQELHLSRDIYEILNKRLVFKTGAHKEASNFITPYGNLLVAGAKNEVSEPGTIVIE
jgi:hypothetical protein